MGMVSIITLLPHFIQEILVLPFVYTIITMIISISFLSIGYLLIVVWMVLSIVFVLGIARDVKMLKIENNNDIDASELKQLENERKMKTYYRNMTEGFDDIDHRNANAMTKKAYNANPLSLVSSRSKSIWLSSKYNKMNMKKMFTTNYNDKGGNSSLDATIESLKSKAKTKKSKYIEHSHKNHKKNCIIPGVVSGSLGSINNSVISSDVDKDYNSWSSMDEIPSQPVRIKVKQHRKNKSKKNISDTTASATNIDVNRGLSDDEAVSRYSKGSTKHDLHRQLAGLSSSNSSHNPNPSHDTNGRKAARARHSSHRRLQQLLDDTDSDEVDDDMTIMSMQSNNYNNNRDGNDDDSINSIIDSGRSHTTESKANTPDDDYSVNSEMKKRR